MGKNADVIKILLLILLGMFIPFVVSLSLTIGFNMKQIAVTFGYFILIFGIELFVVYLFFTLSNKLAHQKIEKDKQTENGKK